MLETAIAAPVVAWLRAEGWDVYQEVTYGQGAPRADIVARKGAVLWVVEAKTSLSLEVVTQAWRWVVGAALCHFVSVAIPRGKRRGINPLLADAMRREGIGQFTVDEWGGVATDAPRFHRVRNDILARALRDEMRVTGEAGNASHRYYTPWRATCEEIARHVAANPGATVRATIEAVRHHWASDATARSCVVAQLRRAIIKGVRSEREGRAWRLYPVLDNETEGT